MAETINISESPTVTATAATSVAEAATVDEVVRATADASVTVDIFALMPLRRTTSFDIDQSRRDGFDAQGIGETE